PRGYAAIEPELLGAARWVPVAPEVSPQLLLRRRRPLRGDMQRVECLRSVLVSVVLGRWRIGCLRGRGPAACQDGEQHDGEGTRRGVDARHSPSTQSTNGWIGSSTR